MKKKIKCVVWDLDNTLWNGVLLEDDIVELRDGIIEIIKKLDERGILQSICSKNEYDLAMNKLKEFGIDEYFIYPQINWNAKSSGIYEIAKLINIGIDSIAFIDDQLFEMEEVNFRLPGVVCIDSYDLSNLLEREELNPRFVTEDSKNRRKMYMTDIKRNGIEEKFEGTQEDFLRLLNMRFIISQVEEGDLQRVEELTVRTHQLNSTGYTYSYKELDQLRKSNDYKLLIAQLDDVYGSYGKIGLALVKMKEDVWTIKLLLMSCRVVSRGVGSVMINYLMQMAQKHNVHLMAEFVPNGKNKMLYVTYKFAGFTEYAKQGEKIILKASLQNVQPTPSYIELIAK